MTTLPVKVGPFLQVECPYLMLAAQDGPDSGTDPDGALAIIELTLTPMMSAGAVARVMETGGVGGILPLPQRWLVTPPDWVQPGNYWAPSTLPRLTWPLKLSVVNLADPDIETDADSYLVSIKVYDPRLDPPALVGDLQSWVIQCPPTQGGGIIQLLQGAPLSAASPQSTILVGPPGPPGAAGNLTIGTVTTGAAGSNASATIAGDPPNQTLSLTIPRGAAGANGPANVLTIGTVTTGAPSSNAAATITGTAPNQVLNLTIPQGVQGNTGSGATDATTTAKGSIQLAGDLAGTAAAPTVPGLAGKAPTVHTHAQADVTGLVAALAALVPTSRTVNDKALTANISLSATDVGAAAATHAHSVAVFTDVVQVMKDWLKSADLATARANLGAVGSTTITTIWTGNQAAYDAISPKVATTLYLIT